VQILLKAESFDPYAELRAYEAGAFDARGRFGATAVFVGSMRDFNEGDSVQSMTLEHYPGMTERHLNSICAEAQGRWPLLDLLVIHRVGTVSPGDAIVLVAVWAGHRAEAFEACRFVMEDLKSKAPFWKKERVVQGERWVSGNTPGTMHEVGNSLEESS
jgi:molybdopterin synthase catalytic subunit